MRNECVVRVECFVDHEEGGVGGGKEKLLE